ncbi:MAG TPA: hypothetical protein VMK16_02935 [Acidimicrobiales bacterium]|nr:hypothetical protein [Acidimicrobiales bacterium]
MRRSIDDYPFDPADGLDDEELARISWAVAIADDYDDGAPRVVLTVEEVGRPGQGLVTHLTPAIARRLRGALRDALKEVGEDPGV